VCRDRRATPGSGMLSIHMELFFLRDGGVHYGISLSTMAYLRTNCSIMMLTYVHLNSI
jgi:hypothetical protein